MNRLLHVGMDTAIMKCNDPKFQQEEFEDTKNGIAINRNYIVGLTLGGYRNYLKGNTSFSINLSHIISIIISSSQTSDLYLFVCD